MQVKDESQEYIKSGVAEIIRFAGRSGTHKGPILVVIGERSVAELLIFQLEVLSAMKIGDTWRSYLPIEEGYRVEDDLHIYLSSDRQPNPIFYCGADGRIPRSLQHRIAELYADPAQRLLLPPLFLIAVREFPNPLIPSRELEDEFMRCVGGRVVDISRHVTIESSGIDGAAALRLKDVFLTYIARRKGLTITDEAERLIEDALREGVTTSVDIVLRLADQCRRIALARGQSVIDRDLLWEAFPENFRAAVQPPEAVMQ